MNQSRTLFVGAALSVTYFPVVAQFIDELNLLTTEFGLLTLSSSMLIQVLSICMVILGVCSTRKTYMLSLQYLLGVFGTLLFAVFIIRPTIKDVIKRTPEGKPVHEYFVTAFLLGTLIMAFIIDYLWQFLFRSFSYGVDHPRWTTFGFHISREIWTHDPWIFLAYILRSYWVSNRCVFFKEHAFCYCNLAPRFSDFHNQDAGDFVGFHVSQN